MSELTVTPNIILHVYSESWWSNVCVCVCVWTWFGFGWCLWSRLDLGFCFRRSSTDTRTGTRTQNGQILPRQTRLLLQLTLISHTHTHTHTHTRERASYERTAVCSCLKATLTYIIKQIQAAEDGFSPFWLKNEWFWMCKMFWGWRKSC